MGSSGGNLSRSSAARQPLGRSRRARSRRNVTFALSLLGRADEVSEEAFAIYAEGDRPDRQVDGDQSQRPAGRPQPEEGLLPYGHALTTENALWTNG
jgi:hypothetical protein